MTKRIFRQVDVLSTQRLTPNLQRIVLAGAELNGFPENVDGDYIKFLFLPSGEPITTMAILESGAEKPVLRTYTISSFNSELSQLTVDFVVHGDGNNGGPASNWAVTTQPGDSIIISGPGPVKGLNDRCETHVLAADMTGLPALAAKLRALPANAKGHALIEVLSLQDIQTLEKPNEIDIQWIEKSYAEGARLADKVEALAWPNGTVSAWVACEFSQMRQLRNYFKQSRALDKDDLYISSYWKDGNTEEQHKIAKRNDVERIK